MSPKNNTVSSDVAAWLQAAIQDAKAVATPSRADIVSVPSIPADPEKNSDNEPVIPDPERKLTTVRTIDGIQRFSNRLDILTVNGWTVVARSGFQVGEFVLFIEPDSFVTVSNGKRGRVVAQLSESACDFMGEQGYRVGTKAYTDPTGKRVLSQGHVFSLRDFPQVLRIPQNILYRNKGTTVNARISKAILVNDPDCAWNAVLRSLLGVDYSEMLGVKKWMADPDTISEGSSFPPPVFVQDPGSKRVQDCPNLYVKPKYKHATFQESVKLDGAAICCYFVTKTSNCFFALGPAPPSEGAMFPNGRFGVCSKNCELVDKDNIYWKTVSSLQLDTKLRNLGSSLALQGELVGSTINGNPYRYPEGKHEFFLYSIIDLDNKAVRMHPRRVEEYAKMLGIKHVPVLGYVNLRKIATSNEGLIHRAEARDGEGLVFKNVHDGRWFKVLSREWIIHRGDEVQAAKAADNTNASFCRAKEAAPATTTSTSSADSAAKIPDSTALSPVIVPAASAQSQPATVANSPPVHSANTVDAEDVGSEAVEADIGALRPPAAEPLTNAAEDVDSGAVEADNGTSGPPTAEVLTNCTDDSVAAAAIKIPTGTLINIDDKTEETMASCNKVGDILPAHIHTPSITPMQFVMTWLLSLDMNFWAPLSHRLVAMCPNPKPFLTQTEVKAMHNGSLTIFDYDIDVMHKAVDEWRRRSMARSLHPNDGGLGTNVAMWAAGTWGDEAPEVNDVYAKVQQVKFSLDPIDEVVWKICGLTDLKNMAATAAEQKKLVQMRDKIGLEMGLKPGWSMRA